LVLLSQRPGKFPASNSHAEAIFFWLGTLQALYPLANYQFGIKNAHSFIVDLPIKNGAFPQHPIQSPSHSITIKSNFRY
jgi:hypothetical protein